MDPTGAVATTMYDINYNLMSKIDTAGPRHNVPARPLQQHRNHHLCRRHRRPEHLGAIPAAASTPPAHYGACKQTIDALGNITSMTYNSQGQITSSQDPLGNLTSFVTTPSATRTR